MMEQYRASGDITVAEKIRDLMVAEDMLSPAEAAGSLAGVIDKAHRTLAYRCANTPEGSDGLDATRHALRVLRNSNWMAVA